ISTYSIRLWHRRALHEAREHGSYCVIDGLLSTATTAHEILLGCWESFDRYDEFNVGFSEGAEYDENLDPREVDAKHRAALEQLCLRLYPDDEIVNLEEELDGLHFAFRAFWGCQTLEESSASWNDANAAHPNE